MSLVKFKAQNHPQQKAKPEIDDRATAPEVFDPLHDRFRFTIDVAASSANAKLPRYFTEAEDGLAQSWQGERVWCNPPYSNIRPWVAKARREFPHWSIANAALVVMLLPANRTEQGWWQDLVEPYRDQRNGLSVEFLRGRLRFINRGRTGVDPNDRPPFGCCLLIWESPIATVKKVSYGRTCVHGSLYCPECDGAIDG
jgi:phage N-6-adenine-methyltransferase